MLQPWVENIEERVLEFSVCHCHNKLQGQQDEQTKAVVVLTTRALTSTCSELL